MFFFYELLQMIEDPSDYFQDIWNYLELLGNGFFAWGAVLDCLES